MTEQEYKQSLNLIQNSVFTNIPLQWVESFQPGIGQIIANIEREVVEWADLNKPIWDSDPAQSGTYNAVKNELLVFAQNLQTYKDDPARSEVIYDFINAARSLYSFNKNYGLDTTPLTNAVNPFKLSVVSSRVTSFGYMHFKSLSNLVKFNEDLLASIDDEKIQLKGYTKTVLEPVREKLYKLITEDPEFKNLLDELGFGEVDDFIQSFAPNAGALESLTDEFFSNFNTFVGNISARLDTERETTDLAIADARAAAQESIDEALGRVDNLVADLSTYQTGVNTQIQSIQSAYESLNSTVQSNVSRIGATEAAIIQEATTRADGFVATASQINAIVSRIDDVDASIIQEANTRASEDAATVDRIDQLVTRVDDNAAAIVNEQNARTTALLAEATARETLAAQLKTDGELYASGLVTSEANVRASQDEILGERIDLVSAEVGGISTAILNEQTARITGDEAEATSRKALSTKLFGTDVIDGITVDTLTSGFLYDQQQSIITQTESAVTNVIGQIAQIETDLTNTRADLLTETTTRVNEYGAIATSVTALSTEFNNQKATLDSLNSIVSGPDGITTQWGIKSDINGYITGVGLISSSKYGTPTSQFIVYADQFALVTPGVNGGQPTLPFFVGSEQGYLELSNTVKSNWNNITGSNKPADNATRNVFRGDWAISTSYVVGDIVLKDGNGWSCILAHASTSGNQPPASGSGNTWWTLYAVKGSDGAQGLHALTVLVPNNAHTLPAASDGVVASYTGSGTAIQIFEGTTALSAVSSITANGQFTIGTPTQLPASTITVGARSYSGTTATVAQHSAMAAGTDSVVVTYPITVRRSDGTTVTLSATQTLTKSKAGPSGTPGDWVSYVFRESASKPTTPTGTATAPVGWLDGPPSSYTNPIWMSKATVSGATGLAGTWSSPVQVTGVNGTNGASGADGSYVVFQYAKNASATTAPTSGWTASPPSLATGEFAWMRSGTVIPPATSPASWDTGYRVSGEKGEPGLNGSRTAILDMYRWAASAPTTFPSGNSTYTWATGQFTAPATTNGWSLTPPAPVAGQTLWIARTLYSDSLTTAATSIAWSATTAIPLAAAGTSGTNGTNGANGTRTAYLELYRWAASVPTTFPSGTSTYTWATGTFTAPGTLNSWSLTPGAAVAGQTLWACAVTYADNNTTATSSVAWNTSTAFAIGAAGTSGTNGVNAKAAFLTATSQVFQIAKTGTTTPSSITLTATGQNVTGSPTFAVTSGTAVLTGTGNERTLASNGLTTDAATIKIAWDGQEDFVTIVKVREGADGSSGANAIVAVLSNESHTIPTDSAGNNGVFTGANTTMTIYSGTSDDSANWTVTASASSVTGTLSGKTYTVTGLSADAGYVDLTASRSGYASIVKRFVLTKSKAGPAGSPGSTGAQGPAGPAVVVTANRALSFTATDGALDGSQANIVLTAAVSGIASPTYAWTFSGLQTNPTASTTSSQTITAAQFGTSKSAVVTCTVNGSFVDQVTIVRLEKSTAAPWATAGSNLGTDLSRWEIGSQTLVIVPDGRVGNTVLRLGTAISYPTQTSFVPIDPTKKYRVRFWARPSSDCNGLLYFSLRQAINETGSWGPVNEGRGPFKPSTQSRASHNATYGTDAWGEYSYIWSAADWQAGVKFFRPEFLNNHGGGTAGYWEVQGLVIEEATDVEAAKDAASAAQLAANNANNTLADIASDNKLTPVEKQSAANEWGIINRERASIQAQADALGILQERWDYDYVYAVLNDYITPLLADLQSPSAIDGPTFRDKWSYFYEYRQRLMNKMSAVAATKADWASVTGSGKPANNATRNPISQGALSARPAGVDGEFYYANDTRVMYQKINGAWVDTSNNTYVDTSGNIQGVAAGAGLSVANNEDGIIRSPGGGKFRTTEGWLGGAIKIGLPTFFTNSMLSFAVDIFEYEAGYSCRLLISGYNYIAGTSWHNVTARVIGGSNVEYPVYFGHDGTRCCVWIGNPTSASWNYPQVTVSDVHVGYHNTARSLWENGWTVGFDTTAITSGTGANQYSSAVLDTLPGADWQKISGAGKPENGATVGANSSNLRAGVGVNMVFNGDYTDGLAGTTVGWRSAGNQHVLSHNLSNYVVQGEGTAYILQPGTNGTAVFDAYICNGKEDQRFAVTPGQRYEFYAYLNVHRCIGYVILLFMDAAGNQLWAADGTSVSHGSSIYSIGDMRMSHVFAVAPANAVKALLIVRGAGINSYDPYVFFSRVYFGAAGAGQTEPSPWSPGRGISQITTSNVSTYIANAAIGAAQIGSINLVGTSNFAVKSGTSGARMDMDSRRIKVFDANDVLRVQLGDLTV